MPELEFAILAEYVRAAEGPAHAIGIGIDAIVSNEYPFIGRAGLLAQLAFTRGECGRDHLHRVELQVRDTDGAVLSTATCTLQQEWNVGLPVGWKTKGFISLNLILPIPTPGLYEVELLIGDQSQRIFQFQALSAP